MDPKVFVFLVFFGMFGIGLGIFLPGAIIIGRLQASLRTRLIQRKLKSQNLVKAEYQAPVDLSAAELGLMHDGKFEQREFMACLLELNNIGVLEARLDKSGVLSLRKTNKQAELAPYQKLLFDLLPDSGDSMFDVMGWNQRSIAGVVKAGLVEKGYYQPNRIAGKVIRRGLLFSVILGVLYAPLIAYAVYLPTSQTGVTSTINGEVVDHFPLPIAIVFGLAFGVWVFAFSLPQFLFAIYKYYKALGFGPDATDKLKSAWTDIEGYKYYLMMVEKDNLEFELSNGGIDSLHLPFAVALGVVNLQR